ncbi:MAG: class I SAM-dependent methyltransferase [Magnetococcales bacterium]|nr:class I SAM-dependent methyltransferase [Magnetococcales bacterium]
MGQMIDFMGMLHNSTRRNYIERVCQYDKAELVAKAMLYDKDYWDGDRITGYGGYHYIPGRWTPVAQAMIDHYQLPEDASILDVGCGKGYLLYEFTRLLPKAQVAGIDCSRYGLEHAKEEVKPYLQLGQAQRLPYPDRSFDLVISLATLHNLTNFELYQALQEIERVGQRHKWVMQESYRNEQEKLNMLHWQLTQRTFLRTDEWEWFFTMAGYTGDYGYIFFQ